MKRFPCLVLDANIVIQLFQLGLWDEVVELDDFFLWEIGRPGSGLFRRQQGGRARHRPASRR